MKLLLSVCLIAICTAVVSAATVPAGFTDAVVASGLNNPTAMALAPDGRIFVCQQGGALRVIKNGALLATPFLTVTVDSSGERGLLGVAFDPNFVSNQLIYVFYTATSPAIHNRISRFTASGDVALTGSETIIMELPNLSSATNHNGGAIHFGPDGNLYVAVGDTRVEFLVNGSLQCTDTTAPYSCNWRVPSAPNKTHTLQARALDQAGNSATAAVTVRSN